MYGVSKETVTKEEAVKYRLANGRKERQMTEILEFAGIEEIVILDSDFRNEYYLYVDELIFSHGDFLRYLSDETGKELEEIILETYSKFNEDVLRHLYEIASGYLSQPQGCFEILVSLESALTLAKHLETIGQMLTRLFNEAIELAYSLKLEDSIKPLNTSQISKYIYLLKNKLGQLENKNFILAADGWNLKILTKVLLMANAQTITITHSDYQELDKQYNQLLKKLTEAEQNKLRTADSKSLNYRLAKADAVILNLDNINILNQKTREEIAEIRQTRKNLYVIDTTSQPMKDLHCETLDIEVIDPNEMNDYNDEEQQQALIEFDEILSTHIKQFMKYFEQFQEEHLTERSY